MRGNVKAVLAVPVRADRVGRVGLVGLVGIVGFATVGCRVEELPPEPTTDETPTRLEVENGTPAPGPGEAEPDRAPPPAPGTELDHAPPEIEPAPVGSEPTLEVDDRFWAGPATRGVELVGQFVTREAMLASLGLEAPVIRHDGRDWVLADILVGLEFGGPGPRARWWVVGPAEVIDPYLARLEEEVEKRGALDELGILTLDVRHCCPEEVELTVRP